MRKIHLGELSQSVHDALSLNILMLIIENLLIRLFVLRCRENDAARLLSLQIENENSTREQTKQSFHFH